MQYRPFGNTGVNISALGFGCMRLPEIQHEDGTWEVDQEKATEMLRHAYDLGINYFDTAPYYCHHNSEIAVGVALKPIRDKVYVSTKCPLETVKEPGDLRKTLENSLKKLDMDYVDFYHFWGISQKAFDEKIVPMDLIGEARKLKEEGLIRHISFSFHDSPEALKHIIDTAEERGVPFESMLVQYNLLDRSNEAMLTYAQQKGLGTVAMGPVGGGRLSAPTELYAKLTGGASIPTYELAFKFVLGNPDLNCALSGMQTLDMVKQNAALASKAEGFSKDEWQQLGSAMEDLKKFSELYCTGCKYCQPCPAGIEIPAIFNMYTYHNVYGLTGHAQHMFNEYVKKGGKLHADCKNCGFCEKKCPQHLQIRELLQKVEAVFNK
ncbi:MAG: aldo/keto reductase [Clostridia bacterium]|nr:aldo/keto reductase [Clostridia bacterium]